MFIIYHSIIYTCNNQPDLQSPKEQETGLAWESPPSPRCPHYRHPGYSEVVGSSLAPPRAGLLNVGL